MSICRGFGCLRRGGERGGGKGVRGEDERRIRRRKKRKEKKKKRRRSKEKVWVDEDVKSFPLFSFVLVLVIDHHLPTNKMPLFSNTAISVFDEKFPGSGLVFDSLSLDIRCYKTVQVLEREASNSSPSQFLSLSPSPFPPSLHSQVTNNKIPLTPPSLPGQAKFILIIGTTSPTNPPENSSLNDYEQQQQQHDNLISKILSPSSSQNKKNHNSPTSSSSFSSSWLRTEHYKLTTAKQEDFQYVESTSPRNEELREKGISQNLSIVSFDFSCLARVCVRKRERKGKEKTKNWVWR